MSRAGNIAISILMWCAIVAYVVAVAHYGRGKRAAIKVQALNISIVDTTGIVTTEKVAAWLAENSIDPTGSSIDSVDVRSIERVIASHPEVHRASAWADLDGTLTVRVEARRPIMRVVTSNGYRFWFTGDRYIMRDEGDFAARTRRYGHDPVPVRHLDVGKLHSNAGRHLQRLSRTLHRPRG